MAKTTEESKVKKKVTNYLEALKAQGDPIYFERREAGGFGYKEGLPDLWCSYNGIHIEIELKQLEGEARTRQEKWERDFRKAGSLYIRPYTFEEFRAWFEERVVAILKER